MRQMILVLLIFQIAILNQTPIANARGDAQVDVRSRRDGLTSTSGDVGSVAQSGCLPSGPQYASWEICGIYFHGNDPTRNGAEVRNRATMLRIALRRQCKIAAPLAPNRYSWDGAGNVRSVERASINACRGAQFTSGPRLVAGYSGGGYKARQMAKDCRNNQAYNLFLTVGAPQVVSRRSPARAGYYPKGCSAGQRVVNNNKHIAFTQISAEYFDRNVDVADIGITDDRISEERVSKRRGPASASR